MKIALVSHGYDRLKGIHRCVVELAEGLSTQHEVHVFLPGPVAAGPAPIRFHPVPTPGSRWYTRYLSFFLASGWCLRRERFDLVHLHVPSLYPGEIATCHSVPIAGIQTAMELRRRGSLQLPGRVVAPYRLLDRVFRYNLGSRAGNYAIAVSAKVARELVRWYRRGEARIRIVPNAVDAERFSPRHAVPWRSIVREAHGIPAEAPTFLFAGNGFTLKGLGFALQALHRLRGLGMYLLVVGDSVGEQAVFDDRVRSLGLQGHVRFAGPQPEIWKYFAACDAFVFPSIYESSGLVILEAMSSGLPVLASVESGSASELLVNGNNGFLISRCDAVEELAERMEACMGDPDRRREMGAHARATVAGLSWDAMIRGTVGVYAEAMNRRDGGSLAPGPRGRKS